MIALVLAMDVHGVIGKNNDLPWHFPEDLKYFKSLTLNKKVLMGRRTYDSIISRLGKPLPQRQNIVATRTVSQLNGVEIVKDLATYLNTESSDDLFVIGGKQIFDIALPYAHCIYITYVKHLFEGDTYMSIDYSNYQFEIIKETNDLIFTKYTRINI